MDCISASTRSPISSVLLISSDISSYMKEIHTRLFIALLDIICHPFVFFKTLDHQQLKLHTLSDNTISGTEYRLSMVGGGGQFGQL